MSRSLYVVAKMAIEEKKIDKEANELLNKKPQERRLKVNQCIPAVCGVIAIIFSLISIILRLGL